MFDALVTSSFLAKALIFSAGEILLGFGAHLAGGCTSGHDIVGMALLARSSVIATVIFMATGIGVTFVMLRVLGGG